MYRMMDSKPIYSKVLMKQMIDEAHDVPLYIYIHLWDARRRKQVLID